jgi:phosphoenolpyruvate phosphomutase / 2-hydroxyethylphosphonate cytidylyltransferase
LSKHIEVLLLYPVSDTPNAIIYIGMAADIIHNGHFNIFKTGALYGKVVIGSLPDATSASCKRVPVVPWEKMKLVFEHHLRDVDMVIPQDDLDCRPNLHALNTQNVVHGSDWKTGARAETRQQVIDTLKVWGGTLLGPQ